MIAMLRNATCTGLLSTMLALWGTSTSAQRRSHPMIPADTPASHSLPHWVGVWGASQTAPYGNETLPAGSLDHATVRETVHLSAGGKRLRVHLSNAFGEKPLVLGRVVIARPSVAGPRGTIDPASAITLTFQGKPGVTVPLGSEYLSDPVDFAAAPGADIVVSLAIDAAPPTPTLHAGARATAFLLRGDHASDAAVPNAATNTRWYFLAGIETEAPPEVSAVVAFGDSITDGHGATTDGNDRWPDDLARRLIAAPGQHGTAVVNQGIGGNCLLQVCIGPPALARFDRDVIAVPGVWEVIVLEGINDLGGLSRLEPQPASVHAELVERIEAAYVQMIERAHSHGIRVIGATLAPWGGSEYYHPDAQAEADRVAVNTWIRTSGTFDAVIDFEAAVRDPQQPDRMLPAYDSGDHLHPGPAGYRRMADAVELSILGNSRPAQAK